MEWVVTRLKSRVRLSCFVQIVLSYVHTFIAPRLTCFFYAALPPPSSPPSSCFTPPPPLLPVTYFTTFNACFQRMNDFYRCDLETMTWAQIPGVGE